MADLRRVRSFAGLALLAAGAAVVVARSGRPVEQLLEGLGVMDPFEPDAGPGPVDVEQLVEKVADLEARLAAVEARWEQFDRNWPESYRHARATAVFEAMGDPG